jgi:hypothetical protein
VPGEHGELDIPQDQELEGHDEVVGGDDAPEASRNVAPQGGCIGGALRPLGERHGEQEGAEAEEQPDADAAMAVQVKGPGVTGENQQDGEASDPVECLDVPARCGSLRHDVAQRRDRDAAQPDLDAGPECRDGAHRLKTAPSVATHGLRPLITRKN